MRPCTGYLFAARGHSATATLVGTHVALALVGVNACLIVRPVCPSLFCRVSSFPALLSVCPSCSSCVLSFFVHLSCLFVCRFFLSAGLPIYPTVPLARRRRRRRRPFAAFRDSHGLAPSSRVSSLSGGLRASKQERDKERTRWGHAPQRASSSEACVRPSALSHPPGLARVNDLAPWCRPTLDGRQGFGTFRSPEG